MLLPAIRKATLNSFLTKFLRQPVPTLSFTNFQIKPLGVINADLGASPKTVLVISLFDLQYKKD